MKCILQTILSSLSNIVFVPPIVIRQAQVERRNNAHRIGRKVVWQPAR